MLLPKDPDVMRVPLALVWLALAAGGLRAEPSDLEQVIAAAREADIVVIGEIHDNPEHHRIQAAIVTALQPGALVFEMIPQAQEEMVNQLRDAGASREEIAAALEWETTGWPAFDGYAGILEAAPGARVFGGGQPVEEVQRAVAEGASAVLGPDAASYGLDQPLPEEEQAAREAAMLAAHCNAIPTDMLAGLVEAQRFRDAVIADAARWARAIAGDAPVVVIAGTGHAHRLRGVPAKLAAADPLLRVLAVGQFEALPDDAEAAAFDAYLLAPPPPRADPCAGFELRTD